MNIDKHEEDLSVFEVDWKVKPNLQDLKTDLQGVIIANQSHIDDIDRWLDLLHIKGQARKKFAKNRSQVQPKLIRKHFEWRIPSLTAPFLETPDLFKLSGRTYEDVYSATQNALVLNYQFTSQIDRVPFIDTYVRTFCSEGTVFFRVGWDFKEEEITKDVPEYDYTDATREDLFILQQAMQMEQTDKGKYVALVPEHIKHSLMVSAQLGKPIMATKIGTTPETKLTTVKNQPDIKQVDYRNLFVDPNCNGDIEEAQFVVYQFDTSMAELQSHGGYQNLDRVLIDAVEPEAMTDEQIQNGTPFNYEDDARKLVTAYEYWGNLDVDGNNTTRSVLITWIGNTIIRMEENPYPDHQHPFVSVSNTPIKNSIYGEADAELLEDTQAIYGAVTRAMIDILGKTANGQKGIRQDMLDAVNKHKYLSGQNFEFNPVTDPRQGIVDITSPEIPVSAQFMLQLQSAEAESLSGVKAYNQGIGAGAYGDVAAGIKGALDSTSKRDLQLVRRLGYGLEKLARKVMTLNAVFLSDTEVIRITEKEFVEVRRDDLSGNIDIKVTVSTAEEESNQAQQLAFMLQTMGNTVPFEFTQIILSKIANLGRLPDLAQRIDDYVQQPDPLAQKKAELEIALLEAQVHNERAKTGNTQADSMLKAAKAGETDVATKQKMLDFIEQEMGVQQERAIEQDQAQSEGNMKLKLLEFALNNQNQPERTEPQESGDI